MVHIVTATDEHIPQVSELFADAFMDDPVWKAIAPSPRIRRHVIKAECEWGVGLRGSGSVDVALDGSADGRVLGALTFETPDMVDIDDEYGWKETLRGLVRGRLPPNSAGPSIRKPLTCINPTARTGISMTSPPRRRCAGKALALSCCGTASRLSTPSLPLFSSKQPPMPAADFTSATAFAWLPRCRRCQKRSPTR